jgi:hypothetical protein
MIYCPNKNSKEFKKLVSSVGENRAYFLWNKYEGNVPQSYFSGIKKDVSELFESNPELANAVYRNLGFFDSKKQTSRITNEALYDVLEDENEYDIDSLEYLLNNIDDNFSLRLLRLFKGDKKFYINNSISEFGLYNAEDDSIHINTEKHIKNNPNNYNILETIVHELTHRFISFNILGLSQHNNEAKNIVDLFNDFKKIYKGDNKYALSSVDEFVSELLSNKVFQKELKEIPYKNSNIFNKFIDYLLSALNIKRDNLLSEAIVRIIEFKRLDTNFFNKFNNNIEIITPQQKQQALQLYSQYLEQNPNGSVEQFKSWVDEFNSKKRTPLQPTEEQLKHIKPLPEKLIDQVNNWKNKSNKEILEILKLYAEVYTKDKELENLIQVLIDNVDKIKFVKFKGIGELENNNNQAEYDGETGEIFVNNIMYQPNNRDIEDRLYRTIIHEYLHGYFLSVLNSPTTTEEKELVEYINEAYDVLTFEYEGTEKWYGFHNVDEFVSELLSNKEFRESEQIKKTGIVQKILNFINQIFFKKYGKNSIEIKQNTFNKILENISILEPSLVRYSSKKGSLSNFISQKSQENNSFQQFQQSLNKPNTNPILQGNQTNVEEIITQLEKDGVLEIDCKGKLKAKKGLVTSFTKGGKWEIYEIFEGKSHKQGGIDINIKNNQISFTNKNGSIKAKYGLVISKDN